MDKKTSLFDGESPAELARLINQDRMVTQMMDGALAGLPPLPEQAQILDVACGPGGWVLDAAFTAPRAQVAGIDCRASMIEYAIARASSQQLPNASFGAMEMTQPLDFTDHTFDLVNARFLSTTLKRDAWPSLLAECHRILRPGGLLRLTECERYGRTNSPSYEDLCDLLLQAMWRAGYGFSPDGQTTGITLMLGSLLKQAGLRNIQYQPYLIDFSCETTMWAAMRENAEVVFMQAASLLIKEGFLTQETFDAQYSGMQIEWRSDDFSGIWDLLTVYGIKKEE